MFRLILLIPLYLTTNVGDENDCKKWKNYVNNISFEVSKFSNEKYDLNKRFKEIVKATSPEVTLNKFSNLLVPIYSSRSKTDFIIDKVSNGVNINVNTKDFKMAYDKHFLGNTNLNEEMYSEVQIPKELTDIKNIKDYYDIYSELEEYKLMFQIKFDEIDCDENSDDWKKYISPILSKTTISSENSEWYFVGNTKLEILVKVINNQEIIFSFYENEYVSYFTFYYYHPLSKTHVDSILYLLFTSVNKRNKQGHALKN